MCIHLILCVAISVLSQFTLQLLHSSDCIIYSMPCRSNHFSAFLAYVVFFSPSFFPCMYCVFNFAFIGKGCYACAQLPACKVRLTSNLQKNCVRVTFNMLGSLCLRGSCLHHGYLGLLPYLQQSYSNYVCCHYLHEVLCHYTSLHTLLPVPSILPVQDPCWTALTETPLISLHRGSFFTLTSITSFLNCLLMIT